MFLNSNIDTLQIEITTNCNAKCPDCTRTEMPDLFEKGSMDLQGWSKLIEHEIFNNKNNIIFNGNFGDFSMHPKALQFLEILAAKHGHLSIHIHTNGGARNTEWWARLAELLKCFKSAQVTFGIDGLEDTNHLYRQNVNWQSLMRNTSAFIANGGNANLAFIVFEHNIHQIQSIQEFAKERGFKKCIVKKSFKLSTNLPNKIVPIVPIVKQKQSAENKHYCYSIRNKWIYIDHLFRLWPCCWLSGGWPEEFEKHSSNNDNCLLDYSLDQILKNKTFNIFTAYKYIETSICNTKCQKRNENRN